MSALLRPEKGVERPYLEVSAVRYFSCMGVCISASASASAYAFACLVFPRVGVDKLLVTPVADACENCLLVAFSRFASASLGDGCLGE